MRVHVCIACCTDSSTLPVGLELVPRIMAANAQTSVTGAWTGGETFASYTLKAPRAAVVLTGDGADERFAIDFPWELNNTDYLRRVLYAVFAPGNHGNHAPLDIAAACCTLSLRLDTGMVRYTAP